MRALYITPVVDVLEAAFGQSVMTSSPEGQFYLDDLRDDGNDF